MFKDMSVAEQNNKRTRSDKKVYYFIEPNWVHELCECYSQIQNITSCLILWLVFQKSKMLGSL